MPGFFAVEVTTVGDGIELLHVQRRLGFVGHMCKLRPIGPDVGHLMRDDQMVPLGPCSLGYEIHLRLHRCQGLADPPSIRRSGYGHGYLAAGRDRLRSCRHVWRFMLPAADQAGNRRAEDGRKPEQPELRDVGSASKQRRTGASRRVDRSVGDRDQEQVNER